MRGPAEADRQDDRLAAEPLGTRDVGDDEGLGLVGAEEVPQRGVVTHLREHGLADAVGMHGRGGDDGERLLRPRERMLDDELDDMVDLGPRGLDRPRRPGHPGAVDDVETQEGLRRRQRGRRDVLRVAVRREEGRQVRVTP